MIIKCSKKMLKNLLNDINEKKNENKSPLLVLVQILWKIAPFIRAINEYNKNAENKINHILVHTGQALWCAYVAKVFSNDLNIPPADIHLEIGFRKHMLNRLEKTMIEFEKVVRNEKPDWIVRCRRCECNMCGSIVAKKEKYKISPYRSRF